MKGKSLQDYRRKIKNDQLVPHTSLFGFVSDGFDQCKKG
jgi:hypothetical protein